VVGYLNDFLFDPERINSPVKSLSGGERNRLLLARMFSQPANLMVMDEPTNDLDIETLELLEDLLMDYDGTLLLVSHDRAFLDAVVTSTIVFEAGGGIHEYVGGYTEWLRQRRPSADVAASDGPPSAVRSKVRETDQPGKRQKMGFKETRELAALPDRIAQLEAQQEALQAQMSDAAFYQQPGDKIAAIVAELDQLTLDIQAAYERWETLESKL
jgi:ATP-binding cassette subfamily F protein uup